MRIENIVKKLEKDGYEVYRGEFDFNEFWMCNGTGLVDIVNGVSKDTSAKYSDVVNQIKCNKSHIYTTEGIKKKLTQNYKMNK